jgi:hypothetical protein
MGLPHEAPPPAQPPVAPSPEPSSDSSDSSDSEEGKRPEPPARRAPVGRVPVVAQVPPPPQVVRNALHNIHNLAHHIAQPRKHYYETDLFYWESRREWSKYLIDMLKWKKKKKGKRPQPPKTSSGAGFYYENTDEWNRFLQSKEKQRYKPRHGSHHSHLFHE